MAFFSEAAGWIAGAISLAAFVPYIAAIVRGRARPNRATWWIWTVVGTLFGASYVAAGARYTVWVPASYVIGPLVIAVLAIKFGEGGWKRFDRVCLAAAGTGVIAWSLSGSALTALILFLLIDLAGGLPTMRKVWSEPASEDRLAWSLFLAGNTVNLFAIDRWSFAAAVYPVYMFIGSAIILTLMLRPRRPSS